jgi:hypothetical protein
MRWLDRTRRDWTHSVVSKPDLEAQRELGGIDQLEYLYSGAAVIFRCHP